MNADEIYMIVHNLITITGFAINNKAEDSLDIVFASQSDAAEQPILVRQPFHKYAVAPDGALDSDQSSDNEWEQIDDSGYRKNLMDQVGLLVFHCNGN